MHILILSPLREGYLGICRIIKNLKNINISIILPKLYEENIIKMIKIYKLKSVINIIGIENYNSDNVILHALKINNKLKIDKVFAFTEYEIMTAAYIRNILKIDGQTLTSAIAFRDKYQMYNYLKNDPYANCPTTTLVNSVDDILKYIDNKHTFILKPRDGAGSVDTFKIKTFEDLINAAAVTSFSNYIIQPFIVGNIYHIDGLILGGILRYQIISKYFNSPLSYKENKSDGSIEIDPFSADAKKLSKYTQFILNKLPTPKNTTFHLEVFYNGDKITFLEIASRLGGGRILQETIYNLNLNPLKLQVEFEVQNKINYDFSKISKMIHTRRSGFILCTPRKGILKKLPPQAIFEVPVSNVYDYYIFGRLGKHYTAGHSSVDAIAAISVFGKSYHEIEQKLITIDKWVNAFTIYETESGKKE